MKILKYVFYGAIALFFISGFLFGDSESETEYEEVSIPTEGLVTVVKEVETDQFKIDDEYAIPETEGSLIIANYMDATSDTFTLAEARLMQSTGNQGRGGSVVRAAAYGYFGMMMLGRMTGARPNPNRYTNSSAHQRATSKAGNSLTSSAKKTTRAKPGSKGKSGFGSKSSRSYGG